MNVNNYIEETALDTSHSLKYMQEHEETAA